MNYTLIVKWKTPINVAKKKKSNTTYIGFAKLKKTMKIYKATI